MGPLLVWNTSGRTSTPSVAVEWETITAQASCEHTRRAAVALVHMQLAQRTEAGLRSVDDILMAVVYA
jgi:hypothetical protein